jgi:hypothetical protein
MLPAIPTNFFLSFKFMDILKDYVEDIYVCVCVCVCVCAQCILTGD